MKLRARTNLDEVFDAMDELVDQVETVANVRAVNRLADQAQTAGFRRVAEIYRIGPRTMEGFAELKLARGGDVEASITVKGAGFPMSVFQPRQTRRGVSVQIKGRRFVFPHSFFIAKFGQRVFARGAYGGKGLKKATGESFGKFQFGRSRLPINQLFSLSPPDAFSNPEVVEAMQDRVDSQARAVFAHELKFAARRAA